MIYKKFVASNDGETLVKVKKILIGKLFIVEQ